MNRGSEVASKREQGGGGGAREEASREGGRNGGRNGGEGRREGGAKAENEMHAFSCAGHLGVEAQKECARAREPGISEPVSF